MRSQDKQFAAATIQTIGRCATSIAEVTDTCLNGLVCLLSNRDGEFIGSLYFYIIYNWTFSVSAVSVIFYVIFWIFYISIF